jgi:DNA adenine methylase
MHSDDGMTYQANNASYHNATEATGVQAPPISLKPPLKWAGGKRWLVPELEPLWAVHRHRRLIEPLSGGLAVTLAMMPSRALLNDINPHTINFYRWLRDGLSVTIQMRNDETLYYSHRRRFNQLVTSGGTETSEAAQLFYYLNRTGYNGLCRFNSRGEFNVPFGRYMTINYASDFSQYRAVFAAWDFVAGDFEQIRLEPDDFVYADPPYDVPFTSYSKETFGWPEQVRLAEWLAHHPGPVVLSNQATRRIKDLYTTLGFEVRTLRAPRRINCTGDRTPADEVLATKGV